MNLTVAITTKNRIDFLVDLVPRLLNTPGIDHIVISDDSEDQSDYKQLVGLYGFDPSVHLMKNKIPLGALKNKMKAVSYYTENDYVLLLDSDNSIESDYVEKLTSNIVELDPKIIYCPCSGGGSLDYSTMAGMRFTMDNIESWLEDSLFLKLVNTGNYVVNRYEYLKVSYEIKYQRDPGPLDVYFFNYYWLKTGNNLFVVPGLSYNHLVHWDSYYLRSDPEERERIEKAIKQKFDNAIKSKRA